MASFSLKSLVLTLHHSRKKHFLCWCGTFYARSILDEDVDVPSFSKEKYCVDVALFL